jgi:HSP20 family protein
MAIIPWRPFWEIERWFEEEWPELEWPELRFPKIRTPRMDIYETDDKVVAEVELPGVKPENINVEVKDNVLRVEAKTEEKKEEKGKGYYRKEMGSRYFKRVVSLPTEVIGEKAEAEYADGILKVAIPKAKPKEVKKKIKIKVKGRE